VSAAHELLQRLSAIGATVGAERGHLVLRAGATPIPPPLVAKLRQTKTEVLCVLTSRNAARDSAAWQARHCEAFRFWASFHPTEEAARIAWGEIQCRWHWLHGERTTPGLCAGCGLPHGKGKALRLGDSNAVHFDGLGCLIAFGERWRGEATAALVAMGLTPPLEDTE
jgi:hypothetical protein